MRLNITKRCLESIIKEIKDYESRGVYLISWTLYCVNGSFLGKKTGSYFMLNGAFSNEKPETLWKIESTKLKGGCRQRLEEMDNFIDKVRCSIDADKYTILDLDTVTNYKTNEFVCSVSYIPKK